MEPAVVRLIYSDGPSFCFVLELAFFDDCRDNVLDGSILRNESLDNVLIHDYSKSL